MSMRMTYAGRKERLMTAEGLLDSAVRGDKWSLSDIFYAVLALKMVVNDLNEEIEEGKRVAMLANTGIIP